MSTLFATALPSYSFAAELKTAHETVREFYQHYLNFNYQATPTAPSPTLKFSNKFNEAIVTHNAICEKYVDGICGWGAEGDVYLNTQETDPKLNYKNSNIKITPTSSNIIHVKLNVYPSEEDTDGYYIRVINYKMIQENGIWVADDIIYEDGISSRKRMEDQNTYAIAHPDKDVNSEKSKQ
jgi:hypothetical protein